MRSLHLISMSFAVALTGCLDLPDFESASIITGPRVLAVIDIRPVDPTGDGMAFCRSLPARCGVVAIPNEVFYARPQHGRHLVRFACCKQLDVIDAAVERLVEGFGS